MPVYRPEETEKPLIIEVWERLTTLRRVSFDSVPGPRSRSGWSGRGEGMIETEPCLGNAWPTLRIFERGQFTPNGHARALHFTNAYRWQRTAERLLLFHERFGTDQPVYLFALITTGSQNMTSHAPHLCGADRYSARLALCPNGLTLDWQIIGPAKDESLAYHYVCGPHAAVVA